MKIGLIVNPIAGIGGKARSPGRVCVAHGGAGRQLHWRVPGDADWALVHRAEPGESQAGHATGRREGDQRFWIRARSTLVPFGLVTFRMFRVVRSCR